MTTRRKAPYFAIGLLMDEVNRLRAMDGEPPHPGPAAGVPVPFRYESEAKFAAAYLLAAWHFIEDARDWPPPWHRPIPLDTAERSALAGLRVLRRGGFFDR